MMISASGERRYPQARGKVIRKSLRGEENLSQPGTLLLVIRWTITLSFHPAIINNSPFVGAGAEGSPPAGEVPSMADVSCVANTGIGRTTVHSGLEGRQLPTQTQTQLIRENKLSELQSDCNNDICENIPNIDIDSFEYEQDITVSSVKGRLKESLFFLGKDKCK